ncbi:MAG: polymerase sigma-54 factor, partial [Pseudomonadota bacterium]|jgi:RNA polymerase sigma-54 factor
MKQSLHLKLGQQLTMTPQLQQAIKLLQMSTLELQQEIQQALDSNMMLETSEDDENAAIVASDLPTPPPQDEIYRELPDFDRPSDIPQELAVDSAWEEVYDNYASASSMSAGEADNDTYLMQRGKQENLHDHLHWQLELTPFSDRDHAIATAIIDAINDDGYLEQSLAEIHEALSQQIDDIDPDEIKAVLHRIQHFDPPGVGAETPADCLRLQLEQMDMNIPFRTLALDVVTRFMEALAKRDLVRIRRELDVEDEDLQSAIRLIRTLEPKPGRRISEEAAPYVVPDVFVYRSGEQWIVSLNPEVSPRLRVNPLYSGMIRRADNSNDNVTMRNHLQEARWFIKSLHSRNETLLKVARSIVAHQNDFLEHGETAMRPLVLRDIADEVGMHESTISRVTTQKYMHTPNGLYEFKYFFSSHVSTEGGGECSAIAIKAFLKEIVQNENTDKPLSDHAIALQLQKRGINVARRTIAKYREAMNIPPSSERKSMF